MPEFCTILAPIRDNGSDKTYKKSQSRLLIWYKSDLEDKRQMIFFVAFSMTKEKIQKSPTIDQEQLKTLLENKT